jgi:hypothetical protein
MLRRVRSDQSQLDAVLRTLRRILVPGSLLAIPVFLFFRLAGGSSEKLQQLPDLIDRIRQPIVWEVPEGGVRYQRFHHGQPDPGHKFVTVEVKLEARIKLGFPVVPRCFRLVDDQNTRHYPLSRSPLFIAYGDSMALDQGTVLHDELLFEIPEERKASHLLFDRYQE